VAALQDDAIVLREWLDSDLDFVFAARQDPELQRFLAGMPIPFTIEDARRYLSYDRQRPVGFAIADVASGEPLGAVWLDSPRGVTEVGYWLAPVARGQGYASRAVHLVTDWAVKSGERAIEICMHPDNHDSQAVAERCGFERAGFVENYATWRDGTTVAMRYVRRAP
jgi:RimJ/RimL family protein N-acetyltransferase